MQYGTAAALMLALTAAACIDSHRVNTECRWSDSVSRPLDLTNAADRDHLRMDAKLAGELGLRLADLRFRNSPTLSAPIRTTCTRAINDSIIERHHVTRHDINVAVRARVWWADLLAVFLPIAIVIGVSMDLVTRRICRSFESDDRTIATTSVVLLTPVTALLGLGVAQFWAIAVEAWLLRNGHVSFRVFQTPTIAHGWITYFAALAVCTAASFNRYVRTPLSGGRRPPDGLGHRSDRGGISRARHG